MYLTHHARRRWKQRFNHLNWNSEIATAVEANGRAKKRIAEQCKKHKGLLKSSKHTYLISKGNIVFVYAPEQDAVLTVFPYENETKPNYNTIRKKQR